MAKSTLQINLEYAIARSILSLLGLLPRRLAIAAGRTMGLVAYLLPTRLKRTGKRNLEIAFPRMGRKEKSRLLRASFDNLGRCLGEFSQVLRINSEGIRRIVDCEGLERLQETKEHGRGAILFTGHLGAWELTALALSAFGYPLSFLVRRIDNPYIETLVDRARTRFGNQTIDKRSAARKILRGLKAGGMVGVLVDLNTQPHEGIFVDFFGTPASTTFLSAKLALHTGATLLPVFAPWDEQRRRFVVQVGQPLNIERTGNEEEDVRRLTALVTAQVESYVRRYPGQWLWIHRRWKTRPPGESAIY